MLKRPNFPFPLSGRNRGSRTGLVRKCRTLTPSRPLPKPHRPGKDPRPQVVYKQETLGRTSRLYFVKNLSKGVYGKPSVSALKGLGAGPYRCYRQTDGSEEGKSLSSNSVNSGNRRPTPAWRNPVSPPVPPGRHTDKPTNKIRSATNFRGLTKHCVLRFSVKPPELG